MSTPYERVDEIVKALSMTQRELRFQAGKLRTDVSEPPRDVREIVSALGITQRELAFQCHRLTSGLAKPRTPSEAEYFGQLADLYEQARQAVAHLWGYHHRRYLREQGMETVKPDAEETNGVTAAEPKTVGAEHFADLATRYEDAAKVLAKLWGYHKGRLERQEARVREGGVEPNWTAVTQDGRVHVGRSSD